MRAITAENVDLTNHRLIVSRAMSDNEEKSTKSGKPRVVPFDPDGPLAKALRAAVVATPTGRLVLTATGNTPTRNHVLSEWKRLQERAGLP
jgi:hypothetical protein